MAQSKLYRQVIRRLSKKEGGKSQVSVGNVREIVGHVADLVYASKKTRTLFMQMGYDRANKRRR